VADMQPRHAAHVALHRRAALDLARIGVWVWVWVWVWVRVGVRIRVRVRVRIEFRLRVGRHLAE